MGAILPLILTFLPTLIDSVEKIFTKSKSGPDKLDAVLQALRAIIQKMVDTGVIPKDVPVTDDALRGIIETVLNDLKKTPISVPPNSNITNELWIVRGTVSKIN